MNIHRIENFFIVQDFLATCACPEIFTALNIFFNIQGFCACPENVHFISSVFCIQEFWATCACPEKQFALISLFWIYIFYHSGFLINLRLPEELALIFFTILNILLAIQDFRATLRLSWIFSLYWIYLSHSGFFSNLRLPWNFSKRGSEAPPTSYTYG